MTAKQIEETILSKSKYYGTWISEELSNYCIETKTDITKIFKKLSPQVQNKIKNEFIDRNMVLVENSRFPKINEFFLEK